jgi:hypothetical protein
VVSKSPGNTNVLLGRLVENGVLYRIRKRNTSTRPRSSGAIWEALVSHARKIQTAARQLRGSRPGSLGDGAALVMTLTPLVVPALPRSQLSVPWGRRGVYAEPRVAADEGEPEASGGRVPHVEMGWRRDVSGSTEVTSATIARIPRDGVSESVWRRFTYESSRAGEDGICGFRAQGGKEGADAGPDYRRTESGLAYFLPGRTGSDGLAAPGSSPFQTRRTRPGIIGRNPNDGRPSP